MHPTRWVERHERLPAEPASARAARRLVRGALATAGLEHLTEAALLLVSEIVTNAVLHAGTVVDVHVRAGGSGVHVDVKDGSPLAPSARHFDRDAPTGRGLAIVDALADAWGIEQRASGKVVWFELGQRAASASRPFRRHSGAAAAPVQLLGVPVSLARATIEHGDAALRELALLGFSRDDAGVIPEASPTSGLELSAVLEALNEAAATGRSTIDVTADFPPEAAGAALRRLAVVDEADRLIGDGDLLIPQARPEIAAFRQWLLGQIALQLGGAPSTAWEPPAPDSSSGAPLVLSEDERSRLDAAAVAGLVADRNNRIVHLNAAAGELLGWPPHELRGRRLTTIVPEHLRVQHLAAFTRLQLTGESSVLNRTVRVPALRRDGKEVPVHLSIELLCASAGEEVFLATLSPARPGDGAAEPRGPGAGGC